MIWAFKRDLALALRMKSELVLIIVFFILVTSLFPLGVGPEPKILREIAPGIAWVAALLANLLALPRLFASDCNDGTLEQIGLSKESLAAVCIGKVAAHWVVTGLPVSALSSLVGLQFGLALIDTLVLMAGMAIGTIVLAWLGAIGAALTLNSRHGPTLLALLVLPLTVPVLIFGAGAVNSYQAGLGVEAYFSVLMAMALLATVGGPFATAAAVRISLQ
jgi:heme exporter protein B